MIQKKTKIKAREVLKVDLETGNKHLPLPIHINVGTFIVFA